jgi:hypothetical protein
VREAPAREVGGPVECGLDIGLDVGSGNGFP